MGAATRTARRTRTRSTAPSLRVATPVVGIGVLAAALRIAWVLVYGRTAVGPNDTLFYISTASNLAEGHGFSTTVGHPTAHWPPGFPFAVSLLYRIFGEHRELGLWLNVVLATATAVLLYAIGRRMFGERGGVIAGTAFAVLPGPLYLNALFLSETTFIFMLVGFLALALWHEDRPYAPVLLGLAAGAMALTKGEGFLAPVIPLAIWWGRVPRGVWLTRAVALVLTMGLALVPWTVRNLDKMDALVLVATNSSTTLWSGHNPTANGGPTYAPPSLAVKWRDPDPTKAEVKEAKVLRREAIKWAENNPLKELGLIPRKLIALNGGDSNSLPIWLNASGGRQMGRSSVIVFPVIADAFGYFLLFVTLAALVLIGGRRLWRLHPGMQGILAYLALCLVIYGFVYYGQWRYRIPMEPFMILVATPLLAGAWANRSRLASALAPEVASGS
jgi:4-amino-4-deoxy-L-arabinose transferase-like glycosyltransferase